MSFAAGRLPMARWGSSSLQLRSRLRPDTRWDREVKVPGCGYGGGRMKSEALAILATDHRVEAARRRGATGGHRHHRPGRRWLVALPRHVSVRDPRGSHRCSHRSLHCTLLRPGSSPHLPRRLLSAWGFDEADRGSELGAIPTELAWMIRDQSRVAPSETDTIWRDRTRRIRPPVDAVTLLACQRGLAPGGRGVRKDSSSTAHRRSCRFADASIRAEEATE